MTWPQALADCGGDYVKARAKHTAIFDAYIEAHKNEFPELESIMAHRRLYPRNGFLAHEELG